jgi:Protein of unknown function (DUF5672)
MQQVAVVIPVYQTKLSKSEQISLRQCQKILGKHPIILVAPEGLNTAFMDEYLQTYKVVRFPDRFFISPKTYNHLLVSEAFYHAFIEFEYILIYQLDAYVFDDQLSAWCNKGYDYIGAPKLKKEHVAGKNSILSAPILMNGGLSLRNVKSLLRYIRYYSYFFKEWKANEDAMFSFAQKRSYPFRWLLKLPNWRIALEFSVEKNPEIGIKLLGGKLPFGCHAWEKYSPKYWSKFIN